MHCQVLKLSKALEEISLNINTDGNKSHQLKLASAFREHYELEVCLILEETAEKQMGE